MLTVIILSWYQKVRKSMNKISWLKYYFKFGELTFPFARR